MKRLAVLCIVVMLLSVLISMPVAPTSAGSVPVLSKSASQSSVLSSFLAPDYVPTPDALSTPVSLPLESVDITIRVSNHTNPNLSWMVYNSRYRVYFVSTLGWGDTFQFRNHNGFEYAELAQDWSWQNRLGQMDYLSVAQGVAVTKYAENLTYRNAFIGGTGNYCHVAYIPKQDGVQSYYILPNLPRTPASYIGSDAYLTFGFVYKLSAGLVGYTASGQLVTTDFWTNQSLYFANASKPIDGIGVTDTWKALTEFYIPAPVATDAAGVSKLGLYHLQKQGNQYWIFKLISYAWLKTAAYPVMIDPTVFASSTSTYIFYTATRAAWSGPVYHSVVYYSGVSLYCARFPVGNLAGYDLNVVTASTVIYDACLTGFPGNSTIVCTYVTSAGVMTMKYSTDGGDTWSAAKTFGGTGDYPMGGCQLAWSGAYTGRLWVGIRDYTATGALYESAVYFADNWRSAAPSWSYMEVMHDDGTHMNMPQDMIWLKDGYLVMVIDEYETTGAIYYYRTTNGGAAWSQIDSYDPGVDVTYTAGITAPMYNYDGVGESVADAKRSKDLCVFLQSQVDYDDYYYSYSNDWGATWTDGSRLDDGYGIKYFPARTFAQFESDADGSMSDWFISLYTSTAVYYDQCGAAAWDDPLTPTALATGESLNDGDNIIFSQTPQNVDEDGYIILVYVEKADSPYDLTAVEFTARALNSVPVNDVSPSCTNLDDTNFLYARYKLYEFSASVQDPNGYADIDYVLLSPQGVYWQVSFDEDTNAFSETVGPTLIELDLALSTHSHTGINLDITFKLKVEWAHDEYTGEGLTQYVCDAAAATDDDDYDTNYNYETRVDLSPAVSDLRDDYNTIGITDVHGTVLYFGSALSPPSTEADIWVSCVDVATSPWSDLVLVTGYFEVAIDSDDVVGLDTYNVKVVAEGAGAGGEDQSHASSPHTTTFIADCIHVVVVRVSAAYLYLGYNTTLTYTSHFEYDGLPATVTATLNDTTYNHAVEGAYGYKVVSIAGGGYGITKFVTSEVIQIWTDIGFSQQIFFLPLDPDAYLYVYLWDIEETYTGSTLAGEDILITLWRNSTVSVARSGVGNEGSWDYIWLFTPEWAYVDVTWRFVFSNATMYLIKPISGTAAFWSGSVPTEHTLYLEVWSLDFTDTYIYIAFESNWRNATLTIWDDTVLVDYFESEGVIYFAVPTGAGTHVIDLLINGSYPHAQGTYNAAFPDDDAWEWRHFNFTVSVVYGDLFIYFYNQHGNNIAFDTFRVYLNGTRHYSFQTTWDTSKAVNVTVVDRFSVTLKKQTYSYAVAIEIELTLYSLKVMSYHEGFVWFNVTKTGSGQYWSAYLAPIEVMNFELYAGAYTIYVNYLNGTVVSQAFSLPAAVYSDYAFLITEDTVHDILYFWSQTYDTTYTINVTLTSTSQTVTTINLNLVNVNSTIQSQLIDILIDIENTNSTVFDQTVSILADISNINSTIFAQTVTMLANLASHNTTIYNQVLDLAADVANTNSTLYTQTLTLVANIANVNSTLYAQTVDILADISNINATLYEQTVTLLANLENVNTTLYAQTVTVLSNIASHHSTIYSQTVSILTNLQNVNSTLYGQTVTILADISSVNSTLYDQTISILTDIQNTNSTIYAQTLTILTNLQSVNSTLYSQTLSIIADIANTNSTVYTQTLSIIAGIANTNSTLYTQTISILADIANTNSTLYLQALLILADISNVNTTIYTQVVSILDVCNRINGTLYAGSGFYLLVWDYDTTDTQIVVSVLTNFANATVAYYHNGSLVSSIAEGLDLIWTKNITRGYHEVAFLVDAGASEVWLNRSYTVVELTMHFYFYMDDESPIWWPIGFKVYCDGSRLVDPMYATTSVTINLTIVDLWNVVVYQNLTYPVSAFCDVPLEVFYLTLWNLKPYGCNVSVVFSGRTLWFYVGPSSSRDLRVYNGTYTVDWYADDVAVPTQTDRVLPVTKDTISKTVPPTPIENNGNYQNLDIDLWTAVAIFIVVAVLCVLFATVWPFVVKSRIK